jgi:hypothetical protein
MQTTETTTKILAHLDGTGIGMKGEAPRRKLGDLAKIARFATGGNAIFTLENVTNGKRFTYKLVAGDPREGQDPARAPIFVHVLTGSNNEEDYELLGMIFRDDRGEPTFSYRFFDGTWGAKRFRARISEDAPSAKGARWLLGRIQEHLQAPTLFDTLDERFAVWHEGRCCRCGRTLTVPASIESGIGPDCAARMEG